MSKVNLPKDELTSLVLAEIRKHDGCEGVDAVVLQEITSPRSPANWEISIVVTGSNPAAAQRAATEVKRNLHLKYRLGPPA